jgi:hypothetical protein
MALFVQVVIGLITTFAGFLLGIAWHVLRQKVTYWRARRFWRPFISTDLKIVVGRFREFDAFEASGLAGVGDMQAAAELVAFLGKVGLRASGRAVEIIYHDQLPGEFYGSNLVCIGGPDANRATERMLSRIHRTIATGDDNTSFRDAETGDAYSSVIAKEPGSGGREVVTLDYGLIVKTSNPINPDSSVLVFAGSFGYGSWAGIRLAQLREFLAAPPVSEGASIECLYKTEIFEEIPQRPKIVLLRRITPSPTVDAGA